MDRMMTLASDEGADERRTPSVPRETYEQRLAARRSEADRLGRRDIAIANARLAAFAALVLLAWLAIARHAFSILWLSVPLALFVILVLLHARVRTARAQVLRAAEFYDRGLERLADDWAGRGEAGERFRTEDHPYAADLDVFGIGSLFELLCQARTSRGMETLASWLIAPATLAVLRDRQGAVAELRDRLDLREDLAVLGPDVEAGMNPVELSIWGAGPIMLHPTRARAIALLLGVLGIATLVGWLRFGLGPYPFVAVVLARMLFERSFKDRVQLVHAGAEHAAAELSLLAHLLARIEREPWQATRLRTLRASLEFAGVPASRQIARLARLIELADSQHNLFFAPLAFLLLWRLQLAFAIESWRARHGREIQAWIDAVAEIEALSSLASHAYEHPADPFPEIAAEGPLFEAEGVGHPLIPERLLVRNDLRLDRELQVLVVSGSNMSGKSTLLRTAGVNTVLALAGGPVRAHRLRLSPLAVGATIGIHDSLKAGVSRFYAEITRLKQLVELGRGAPPLLFLFDELLHGTNSHDRKIGAEAVVRSLIERGAIGLVTTHDLALAHVAEVLAPRAANVHFEDHLEDGRMTFDYQMRPGVVTKSNALALMRAVGLEV